MDLIASAVLRAGQDIPTLFLTKPRCLRTADQHRPRHRTEVIRGNGTSSSALVCMMLKPAWRPSAAARLLELAISTGTLLCNGIMWWFRALSTEQLGPN